MEIILVAVIFYGGGYLLIKWLNNFYDKNGSLMYPIKMEEEKSYSMQSDTTEEQNHSSNTGYFGHMVPLISDHIVPLSMSDIRG